MGATDMSNLYITRMSLDGAESSRRLPEAVYRLTIDGEAQTADRSGSVWFTDFRRADAAARRAVTTSLTDRIVWEPQYDSTMAEALDEPCGYVGKVA